MTQRPVVATAGRALISLGALVLLFLAYQLWGTGFAESRSQDSLRRQLAAQLHASRPTSPTQVSAMSGAPSTTGVGSTPPRQWPPADGSPEGRVSIPAIGVDQVFVEGTGTAELRRGPGHYTGTPLPGQAGNAALAGHRTTYGAPFNKLDGLRPGDEIMVTTVQGSFHYDVRRSFVVKPSDVWVVAPTPSDQLTLTTCTPRFSASHRLIVQAALVGSPVSAPPGPRRLDGSNQSSSAPKGAWVSLGAWGLAAAAVLVVASRLSRRLRRRWPVYLLLAPAFFAALVMLFASAGALLPDMV